MVANIFLVKIRSIGCRHLRSQDQDRGCRHHLRQDQVIWSQTFPLSRSSPLVAGIFFVKIEIVDSSFVKIGITDSSYRQDQGSKAPWLQTTPLSRSGWKSLLVTSILKNHFQNLSAIS